MNDGPARTGAEPLNLCRRNTQTLTYADTLRDQSMVLHMAYEFDFSMTEAQP